MNPENCLLTGQQQPTQRWKMWWAHKALLCCSIDSKVALGAHEVVKIRLSCIFLGFGGTVVPYTSYFFLSFHCTAVLLASLILPTAQCLSSFSLPCNSWMFLIKKCCLPDVCGPDVLLRGLPWLLTLQVCCRNWAPVKSPCFCMRLGWNWPCGLHFCAWDNQRGYIWPLFPWETRNNFSLASKLL